MNPGKQNKSPKSSLAHLAAANSALQKSQQTLVSPVLREVGKLAAGVASVSTSALPPISTGSATGNPRNKCALSPGHSLMDWIRLGASGKDLTGVGSRAGHLSVTPKELSSHCKEDDAWLAIRGKVYNVTAYLPFHPGGPQELMKGAGIDATKLFDQVHPWVNYDSILQKCFIGRLVNVDPNVDTEALFLGSTTPTHQSPSKSPTLQSPKSPTFFQSPRKDGQSEIKSPSASPSRAKSPNSSKKEKNIIEVASKDTNSDITVKSGSERNDTRTCDTSGSEKVSDKVTEVWTSEDEAKIELPRFDWIQKLSYITVIFYTKPFANPLIEIYPPNVDQIVNIRLNYNGQVFSNELKYERPVERNIEKVRVSYETGKVEVIMKKREAAIWNNYGVLTCKYRTESALESKHPYVLRQKVQVNHNTFLLQLQRTDDATLIVPIGKHLKVYIFVNGNEMWRSYTPVPNSVGSTSGLKLINSTIETPHTLWLLVKRYPVGNVSKALCDTSVETVVHLSKPMGSFNLASLEKRETFLLLAAGTGLTPMLQLIVFLLERRIRRSQNVRLLFFNKTEGDILIKDQLEKLQKQDDRFKVQHILSEPTQSWTGLKGHVNSDLLTSVMNDQLKDSGYTKRDIFFAVCGPTAFTALCRDLLLKLHITEDQFHLFAG